MAPLAFSQHDRGLLGSSFKSLDDLIQKTLLRDKGLTHLLLDACEQLSLIEIDVEFGSGFSMPLH